MKGISIHKGRTNSPCFKCEDHSQTCRANCKAWKDWETLHAKEREEINKRKREYSLGYGAPYRSEKEWKSIISSDTRAEARVFKQRMK